MRILFSFLFLMERACLKISVGEIFKTRRKVCCEKKEEKKEGGEERHRNRVVWLFLLIYEIFFFKEMRKLKVLLPFFSTFPLVNNNIIYGKECCKLQGILLRFNNRTHFVLTKFKKKEKLKRGERTWKISSIRRSNE